MREQWRSVIRALEMWPISHQAPQRLVSGIICQRWLTYSPLPSREMGLSPNLEKSAIKWEKRCESALTLEKGLSMKSYLNVLSTRDTFHACLWLEELCPRDINPFCRWIVLTKWSLFSFSCSTEQVQHQICQVASTGINARIEPPRRQGNKQGALRVRLDVWH